VLCFRTAGTRLVAVDRSAARVARAQALGIGAVVLATSLRETILPFQPEGADVVVDATGHAPVLTDAVGLARALPWGDENSAGARLVIQGSYPEGVAIPYAEVFARELQLIVLRECTVGDIHALLDLVTRGLLLLAQVVSDVASPEDAASVYAELRTVDTSWVTAAFCW